VTTKCFFLAPTDRYQVSLRRLLSGGASKCPHGYCDVSVVIGIETLETPRPSGDSLPHDDPRWPTHCTRCGADLDAADFWQLNYDTLYTRSDGGPECTTHEAPPGAMWYAPWYLHENSAINRGPDGNCLVVRLPNGNDWIVDGRASNCTLPHDDVHKCWVREGTPPNVTAGKAGHTCSAGAGSIGSGSYHGFLRNGVLT